MTISGYCQLVNSADIYFRIIPAPLNHGSAVNAKSTDTDPTEFFFLLAVDSQRAQLHRNLYRVNQDPQCKRAASFPP